VVDKVALNQFALRVLQFRCQHQFTHLEYTLVYLKPMLCNFSN